MLYSSMSRKGSGGYVKSFTDSSTLSHLHPSLSCRVGGVLVLSPQEASPLSNREHTSETACLSTNTTARGVTCWNSYPAQTLLSDEAGNDCIT